MNSVRLPGKMLLRETGRTLVEHTHEVAVRAGLPDAVIVATDHPAIAEEVRRFGGEAMMTSADHPSGADRVAEVASRLPEFDLFVNLQGDEPELDPAAIDLLISQFDGDPSTPMATLAAPLEDPDRLRDPSVVKVVFDSTGRALYFSRSPIPFVRDAASATAAGQAPLFHQHIGIYAYRREFLAKLPKLPPSPLEQAEKLEQLRVLQAGLTIRVGVVAHAAAGIDTAADYAGFVRRQSRALAA
jgi:3-deoxy-manno-octulosonate cytidylyltransferase (CMP-KDO synthetase)